MTNIVANDLVLLGGGRGEGPGGGGGEEGAGGRSRGAAADNDFDQRGPEPAGAKSVGKSTEITDDDIPF
jgi:single-stranded DNA-binding protein